MPHAIHFKYMCLFISVAAFCMLVIKEMLLECLLYLHFICIHLSCIRLKTGLTLVIYKSLTVEHLFHSATVYR